MTGGNRRSGPKLRSREEMKMNTNEIENTARIEVNPVVVDDTAVAEIRFESETGLWVFYDLRNGYSVFADASLEVVVREALDWATS